MTLAQDLHDFLLYSNVPGFVGVVVTWAIGLGPVAILWCIWLSVQIIAFVIKNVRQDALRRTWLKANPGSIWPGDIK